MNARTFQTFSTGECCSPSPSRARSNEFQDFLRRVVPRLAPPGTWKGVFDHITYAAYKVMVANWTLTIADAAVSDNSAVVSGFLDNHICEEMGRGWEVSG
jgi:hypothetical protein